ncbi:outer membrane beta-barrel protein [Sediminibacterium ginsengisoli]|uniref:outer membrane beta-barrel protein n=1 Tax=Sediminibacterium ginsengisoli TaxID=413434 RepID=UPI0015909230|nr:outer membrane beta-barrel protein [Sediminibacterium ginsengisoli]
MHAQNSGQISGKIVDSVSGKPLSLATVSVFTAADTTLVTYRLSNDGGDFKVTGLPLSKQLRVIVSYSGYAVYRQEFSLTAEKSELNTGTVALVTNANTLDEVLVIAERPPVVVKRDTIEFNASAFKTLPSALVEDLLKKLPGVQLDADVNITVNGKKVNRIMVDGKDFFGGDPKMATRNLPANVIEKIQVVEDKEDAEQNPDKPKSDIGQVINLKLKKDVKKGWFGKAYAGGGTDERYETGGIINTFRDTLQLSLLGFANNLNKAGFGFNDIRSLGGFDRSGINSITSTSGGGLSVNGISFGGIGEGVQTSAGGGFNLNTEFKKNITLNGQYFYGQTRNDITELNSRKQFLGDTILTTTQKREEVQKTFNHRFGMGLKWRIDSLTRLEFRPGLVISDQESNRLTNISTESNKDGLLNQSNNRQQVNGHNVNYNHSLTLNKTFRKKGRSLNVYNYLYNDATGSDQYNNVLNTFYPTGSTTLDQLRDRDLVTTQVTLNTMYYEPISKSLSLRLAYLLNYTVNKDDLSTFNKNGGNGKYDQINPLLTNNIERTNLRNTAAGSLIWKYKALTVTATGNLLWLDLSNKFISAGKEVPMHYTYFLPGLYVNWKIFNVSYDKSITPPSLSDIQPVADNTNPLYINKGNPDLLPAERHNVSFSFFKNIPQQSLLLTGYLNGSFTNNGVIRSRTIDANGIQTTMPVNSDDIYSIYSNLYFNKQFKLNKSFQFTIGAGYNVNYNRNLILINNRKSATTTIDANPYVSGGINWKDKIEWNIAYTRGYNKTRYESNDFTDLDVNRHSLNTDIVLRWPKGIVWESNLNYRYNSQVAPGMPKSVALLGAGVTFLFLKEDKGQLKLSVSDLLNQNTSIFRYAADNYINDRQINVLQRYFMLTFTYNIRSFKGGKVGGSQKTFFFL